MLSPFLYLPDDWEKSLKIGYAESYSRILRRGKIMTKLQIIGVGCLRCRQLAWAVETAAKELGIEYELTYVSDMREITSMGVCLTPALAVNGKVQLAGKVPSVEEIKKLLV